MSAECLPFCFACHILRGEFRFVERGLHKVTSFVSPFTPLQTNTHKRYFEFSVTAAVPLPEVTVFHSFALSPSTKC